MSVKNKILLLPVCLVVFVLAGCNPANRFSVTDITIPTLNGLRSVHGKATVCNGGRLDVVIESATLTFRYKERPLATARLMLPIELPTGETSPIRYDFALELTSISSLGTIQTHLATDPDRLTVDVRGYVRSGGIRRKIDIERVPVIGIISNFAP